MSVDLIINPHARSYLRDDKAQQALRRVAGDCRVHTTENLNQLDEVCARIIDDTSLVLLAGGDGSLMAGVSALARHAGNGPLPPLAPIPGGTAGTVARNWGLHGRADECLQRMLTRPRRLIARPTLRVRSDADDDRVGFIFGTGLVASFFDVYYARGAPGYAGAAKIVARIFAESFVGGAMAKQVLTPLSCRLSVDGELCQPEAWSLICSAVIANLGIGMRLIHRAAEDPARPHLVASPLGPKQLGPRAPLVLAGKSLGGADNIDQLVDQFTVEFDTSGPFVLDGELLKARRIDVSAGPLIQVATPQ